MHLVGYLYEDYHVARSLEHKVCRHEFVRSTEHLNPRYTLMLFLRHANVFWENLLARKKICILVHILQTTRSVHPSSCNHSNNITQNVQTMAFLTAKFMSVFASLPPLHLPRLTSFTPQMKINTYKQQDLQMVYSMWHNWQLPRLSLLSKRHTVSRYRRKFNLIYAHKERMAFPAPTCTEFFKGSNTLCAYVRHRILSKSDHKCAKHWYNVIHYPKPSMALLCPFSLNSKLVNNYVYKQPTN